MVVGIYVGVQTFTAQEQTNQEDIIGSREGQIPDEDNDGLDKFEEDLWGTDPNKKDTDGDGTPDGKEVELNRDPTKATNDKLTALEREEIEDGKREGFSTNKTKQLYGEILPSAIVVADQQSGTSSRLSKRQLSEIKENTVDNIDSQKTNRPYSTEDITVVDSTKKTRQNYAQTLYSSLEETARQQPADELELFADAARGMNTTKKFGQMKSIAENYTDLSRSLLEMEVPEGLEENHTKVTNNFHSLALSIEEMTKLQQDPARALAAIERYRDVIKSNSDTFYKIGQRFNEDLSY